MNLPARRGQTWLVALLLCALALLLRVPFLDAHSLWLDEGSTWALIQQPWSLLLADLFSDAAAYPLYHLLLKGWVLLAGDSEAALRLPSALFGAAAVPVLYAIGRAQGGRWYGLLAALLLAGAPFAIWYAQEAKVYSLLLLVSALLLWALLRALEHETARAWLLLGGLALLSLLVHRLALLLLLGGALAIWLTRPRRTPGGLHALIGLLLAGACVSTVVALVRGLGSDISATGAYLAADPLTALRLTFVRFSVDRWPGEAPWWWLLPWLALAPWGLALLLRDALRPPAGLPLARRRFARVLLCVLLLPLALFLAQLAFTRLYEPRFVLLLFPAWLLLLAYPATRLNPPRWPAVYPALAAHMLVLGGAALLVGALSLVQPRHGLFSGYPVKEQYRAAVGVLAREAHPDDLVVLHPAYLRPLYDYYMARLRADPPPVPVSFAAFKHRQTQFNVRDWDTARRAVFAGHTRSFLLIAPEHARTVDRPLAADDEYGLVGLYFRFSREQQKWPCGIWRFNGAHVLCQDSPEAYVTGAAPTPATPLLARFGPHIVLHGFTLKATTAAGPGVYRAGGTLPLTLFWDVTAPPPGQYHIFVHLCQQCDQPPAASTDGPPLQGYLPTHTWIPGNLVHDERTLLLPADLSPGTYQLYVGLYDPANPAPEARLPVDSAAPVDTNRLLLGTVELRASGD